MGGGEGMGGEGEEIVGGGKGGGPFSIEWARDYFLLVKDKKNTNLSLHRMGVGGLGRCLILVQFTIYQLLWVFSSVYWGLLWLFC